MHKYLLKLMGNLYQKSKINSAHTNFRVIESKGIIQDSFSLMILSKEALDLRFPLIPVDPHIAYGNSLPQERIPRNAPGTFSTHRIPGKDDKVVICL